MSNPVATRTIGSWVLNYDEDHPVQITATAREQIEAALARYVSVAVPLYRADYPEMNFSLAQWGCPAPVVRLDMPSADDGYRGTYEFEANVSGMHVTNALGVPLAVAVARTLHRQGVNRLFFGTLPSRQPQGEDHRLFMGALADRGIETMEIHNPTVATVNGTPVWLRAGEEDAPLWSPITGNCLLLHNHGGGHKGYLPFVDDAVLLSDVTPEGGIDQILARFPEGFVLKPKGGWGTHHVLIHPTRKPWKNSGHTRTKLVTALEAIRAAGTASEWIVQRFHEPTPTDGDKNFLIWRLFAVWDGAAYRIIGGVWAKRPSLLVHGASDTI